MVFRFNSASSARSASAIAGGVLWYLPRGLSPVWLLRRHYCDPQLRQVRRPDRGRPPHRRRVRPARDRSSLRFVQQQRVHSAASASARQAPVEELGRMEPRKPQVLCRHEPGPGRGSGYSAAALALSRHSRRSRGCAPLSEGEGRECSNIAGHMNRAENASSAWQKPRCIRATRGFTTDCQVVGNEGRVVLEIGRVAVVVPAYGPIVLPPCSRPPTKPPCEMPDSRTSAGSTPCWTRPRKTIPSGPTSWPGLRSPPFAPRGRKVASACGRARLLPWFPLFESGIYRPPDVPADQSSVGRRRAMGCRENFAASGVRVGTRRVRPRLPQQADGPADVHPLTPPSRHRRL